MTDKEYDKLTDEEVRIKIAELDGWKRSKTRLISTHDVSVSRIIQGWKCPSGHFYGGGINVLPDYLNDLNACYEFEEDLPMISEDGKSLFDYTRTLSRLVRKPRTIPMVIHDWELLHATARQRCKAFVLTSTE